LSLNICRRFAIESDRKFLYRYLTLLMTLMLFTLLVPQIASILNPRNASRNDDDIGGRYGCKNDNDYDGTAVLNDAHPPGGDLIIHAIIENYDAIGHIFFEAEACK
jgi:hypothetical protein